jgi:hypothetical protein
LLLIEGQLVLATEAERGEYPSAVLHAIAAGHTRYGQIKDVIRAEPARTLERLQELRLIEKLTPVTDPGRTRRAIYRIADNFLAFYLGVLSRFRTEIERGLGESIAGVLVQQLDGHAGPRWEDALRRHVRRLVSDGALARDVVGVGAWWSEDSTSEIDVVAVAGLERKPVLAGEAKWARRASGERLARQLAAKARLLPGVTDPGELRLLVCARDSLTNVPRDVLGVTAHDIFA